MDDPEIFKRLGLALAIGLLFGVERGWHTRTQSGGARVAGIRTFALIGLFGGISGWLAMLLGPAVLGFIFVGFVGLVAVTYWVSSREEKDLGMTTEVAALLVFVLGAASILADMAPVAAAAVVATALLAVKSVLHRWIHQMQELELTAAIELAIISVVLLPLLPDRGYGPGGILNPYELWWAVVLVAGLSFVGYLAIRIAGPQLGTLFTGLLGGLASSTATTLALARMARRRRALAPVLAVGTVLAGSVTFLRILVVASVFNGSLTRILTLPLVAMAVTGVAGALILHLTTAHPGKESHPELHEIANPLELRMALAFAAFLALVVVATHYFQGWFGNVGIYAVAAVSGISDVDAVTISMARMSGDKLGLAIAGGAIVTAASVNTVVKAGIALVVGGRPIGSRVIGVYIAVLTAGALGIWLS
jgi:uncharacterized membrane protein (DUF4010 family)